MDKPSSGEKGHERARGAVRDQIGRIVKMSQAVKMEPDLSPVWDGEEFRSLPADAQAEIRAQAEKEGYAKPETAAVEENDPRTQAVRDQIGRIVKMSQAVKMEPDLSPVWDGEEFEALPPELQDSVRAWASAQGLVDKTENAPEPATQERAAERPDRAEAPEKPERKERKERREGPKRKFQRYHVAPKDDGSFVLHEDFEEWNDETGRYDAKTIETTIGITDALAEKLADDPDVAGSVAGFCGQVREELERSGVKIFFDRPKGEPEKIYPKWKYALEGKTIQDPIRIDDMPAEILALVRDDKEYFKSPAWKKWFGKQLQRKREDIIGAELAKLFPEPPKAPESAKQDVAPTPPGPKPQEPDADTQATAVEEPKGEKEPAVVTPELVAGIDMLVDKFAPLFELPRDSARLVEYVAQFAKGIFEYQVGRGGKKTVLPPDALHAAIKAAILSKFPDDRALAAEIDRVIPDAGRTSEKAGAAGASPEQQDETIEVQDEWIESEERETSPVDAAYAGLRGDLDKMSSPKDLEEFTYSLRELKKSGLETVAAAADRLLADIEFGRAGELSEDRLEGLSRTPAEREFFDRHPALDKRNVQRLEDGRVIAHIDRLRPQEALRRVLGRAVDDALAQRGIQGDARMLRRISEYVMNIVTGGNPNEMITARFTKDLAAFDLRAEEFVIKNIDKLGGVIANLAKKIESERP